MSLLSNVEFGSFDSDGENLSETFALKVQTTCVSTHIQHYICTLI